MSELTDDQRFAALVSRDRTMDGLFYYAVRTTGIVCRPSCSARAPKREHVEFFETVEAAQAAGYRDCKRCRPAVTVADVSTTVTTSVCRAIDEAVQAGLPSPRIAELADRTGYSRYHLQRLFRAATGLTLRGYASAARAQQMQTLLAERTSVSAAIHDAGYGSSSRFYEHALARQGMTAQRMRAAGAGETLRFAIAQTSLGPMLVAATAKGICTIQFSDDPDSLVEALQQRFSSATLIGDDRAFEAVVSQVVQHIEEPNQTAQLPLDIRGTVFQQRVWSALMAIHVGETVSYAQLAERIGQPTAVRAVASACAANEIAVIIPCHRVVRTGGALSGYRWGVERKAALLARETSRR